MSDWNIIQTSTQFNNTIDNIKVDINKINNNINNIKLQELSNEVNNNLQNMQKSIDNLNNKFDTLINLLNINDKRYENLMWRTRNTKKKYIKTNLLDTLFGN